SQCVAALYCIALEWRYHTAGVGDEGLSFVGVNEPVQEAFVSFSLFVCGVLAAVNVEELGTAAHDASCVSILDVLWQRHDAYISCVIIVDDIVPFPGTTELEGNFAFGQCLMYLLIFYRYCHIFEFVVFFQYVKCV